MCSGEGFTVAQLPHCSDNPSGAGNVRLFMFPLGDMFSLWYKTYFQHILNPHDTEKKKNMCDLGIVSPFFQAI